MIRGEPDQLSQLLFHVPNFRHYFGDNIGTADGMKAWVGRARMEFDPWQVTLDELPGSNARDHALRTAGGYALTHVGTLKRKDGATFSGAEATSTLVTLANFLSFFRGRWVAPILWVGRDA